ncbi:MAG: maleylpyruvate isomerase N-terminal domain-containing protein, partial [Dehalococcoidia bacterium]
MTPLAPIDVRDLFPGERAALLDLLGSLTEEEWEAPTACAGWSVQDVALHLLGDDVGRLAAGRDGVANPAFRIDPELDPWTGLVAAIDHQNAVWVE